MGYYCGHNLNIVRAQISFFCAHKFAFCMPKLPFSVYKLVVLGHTFGNSKHNLGFYRRLSICANLNCSFVHTKMHFGRKQFPLCVHKLAFSVFKWMFLRNKVVFCGDKLLFCGYKLMFCKYKVVFSGHK